MDKCTDAGRLAYSGTADLFLRSSQFTRTRHVSTLALAKLQQHAFHDTEQHHDDETEEAWMQEMIAKSPTFLYWD